MSGITINPTPLPTHVGLLTVPPASPGLGGVGAGVWGFAGPSSDAPTQTSKPPLGCGVYGEGGIVGIHSLAFDGGNLTPGGDGVIGFGAGTGVHGVSSGGSGARGVSDSGSGVWGTSTTGVGVLGTSQDKPGVRGETVDGDAGVVGVSTGKGLAGNFYGHVNVGGDIKGVNTVNVSGDVILQNGHDCAEQFDMHGDRPPEPGTIVVIDDNGTLRESERAYDTRVAGVISGAGDFRPGLVLGSSTSDSCAPVALVGRVFCKVDADFAPISVGDLLTTSQRPGFAMKASDPKLAFGAVIGKALKCLQAGQGEIPILVALQ
jgi:hypothetical protein